MAERIVAFDLGDKRIGVAVSDPFCSYAVPCETYFRTGKFHEDVEAVASIARAENATRVVCGLPVYADGTRSCQTEKAERFIAALREMLPIPVETEDERYTTQEARRELVQAGVSTRQDKKKRIDSEAAAFILERYLLKFKKNAERRRVMDSEFRDEDDLRVELVAEDGSTEEYEHRLTFEYKGEWYVALAALPEEDETEEEGAETEEIYIYHIVGEGEDEHLEVIEDDAFLDEVFAEFCNQYEDFEDADEAASLDGDDSGEEN